MREHNELSLVQLKLLQTPHKSTRDTHDMPGMHAHVHSIQHTYITHTHTSPPPDTPLYTHRDEPAYVCSTPATHTCRLDKSAGTNANS